MKILSPIDRPEEAGPLVEAGADELYGGYVSDSWKKKYSLLGSANQRYFAGAQFSSGTALKAAVREVHAQGAKFYLALNAPYYTEAQYKDVTDEAARIAQYGVDAFIVADVGLVMRLKGMLPRVPVHLSTLSAVFNSKSAEFFASLGVARMVLPRELTLAEMAGITGANKGIEFDAFVMVGKCPNIECYCSFTHNSPDLIWPCEMRYRMEVVAGDRRAGDIIRAQSEWSRVNRRQACGLCAVARLEDAGVTALKLVGRGGPTAAKVKAVGAVKRMLGLAREGLSQVELAAAAKKLYKGVYGQECNPYICYFPEVWKQ